MVVAMDVFTKLFGNSLAFVYHCFDRIVIHGYLSALSRPEQVVHFVRKVVGVPVVSKEILSASGCIQAGPLVVARRIRIQRIRNRRVPARALTR
jgi:hypothetical protein